MRWFFEQAFSLLFPEHMPSSGSDREYFITLGICYIAEQQKFIPPLPEEPITGIRHMRKKNEYIAFEYCKSRFNYLLNIHEEENGVLPDIKYTLEYHGKSYEESKYVILTAVYALKLLEDYCSVTDRYEWTPRWTLPFAALQRCSAEDINYQSDAHDKKYRMALILICVQLAGNLISDDNLVNDRELAEVFSLTLAEFTALQLKVLDQLDWKLCRTYEELLVYTEQHELPSRIAQCIAEHEDAVNTIWVFPINEAERTPVCLTKDITKEPHPSPVAGYQAIKEPTKLQEALQAVIASLESTTVPLRFSSAGSDQQGNSGSSSHNNKKKNQQKAEPTKQ